MQEGFEFGFYNSKEGSVREYNANQFGRMFDGVITDGVFSSIGNNFRVSSLSGLNITVDTGRAWLNHTWNEAVQLLEFKLESSNAQYDRYDTVVLRVDANELNRENKLYVKTGTPANPPLPPELDNDADNKLFEYPIAVIKVPKLSTSITNNEIINLVGLDSVPSGYNLDSYNNYLLGYAYVISENSTGEAKIIVHSDASVNETAWTPAYSDEQQTKSIGFKKVFSNMSNIQNTCGFSTNAIFNTDIFISIAGKTSKDIQDEEESFSYIYKYELNDNDGQLVLYAYYQTKKDITVRFVGKGVNKLDT